VFNDTEVGMGLLVDGKWHDKWYDTDKTGGRFEREKSAFRNWVTPDGSAGPTGDPGFKAEAGRYHLYVSLACPWAHRTLIFRRPKKLEGKISLSVVHWLMLENGWTFKAGDGVIPDPQQRRVPCRVRDHAGRLLKKRWNRCSRR
jgi:putative glutathione S-transferase